MFALSGETVFVSDNVAGPSLEPGLGRKLLLCDALLRKVLGEVNRPFARAGMSGLGSGSPTLGSMVAYCLHLGEGVVIEEVTNGGAGSVGEQTKGGEHLFLLVCRVYGVLRVGGLVIIEMRAHSRLASVFTIENSFQNARLDRRPR